MLTTWLRRIAWTRHGHSSRRIESGVADVRVAASAARFHLLANDPHAALDTVDRFVRVADPGTTDGIARQRQAAELLDQLTRLSVSRGLNGNTLLLAEACERYRACFRAFPEAVAPMAALLAFAGQVDAAFVELDKQKSRLSTLVLCTAGVSVLRSGNASSQQFQTVKAWIDRGLADSPNSLPLKLDLAELHTLRQDFAIAEQTYRDVLRANPKNLVALNNLAWILAPRPDAATEALQFADRAIDLYGASPEILDTRARILISAGQCNRAIADLTDAINQSPTPLRLFHLALRADEVVSDGRGRSDLSRGESTRARLEGDSPKRLAGVQGDVGQGGSMSDSAVAMEADCPHAIGRKIVTVDFPPQ